MNRRGLLLFAALGVIWGTPYLLIRVAVGGITPAVLVFGRTVIGALMFMPVVLARGGLREIGSRGPALLAYALCEVALPWVFLSSAEQRISSSLAGLLVACVPLVGTVIAPLFGNRERLNAARIGGLVVGMAGVAAIVGLDFRASDAFAFAQMAGVVICYAIGPAIVARYLGGVSAATVNGVSLAACAVIYAPVAAIQWPRAVPAPEVLVSVAVLGVVCTGLALVLFFALIREVGPVRATVITYINPAVAAAAGIVVLRERFTLGMGIGLVLVLAGSFLATRRPNAARAEGPA
jgi:drug/metabolite transporter (DMT)-like permease